MEHGAGEICMRAGTAIERRFERSHWPRIQLICARFDDIASRHRDAPLPGDDVGQVGYVSRFRVARGAGRGRSPT